MCRLAFIPKATMGEPGILQLANWLVKQRGGHGNGVGFWSSGNAIVEKGVFLTSEELFDLAGNRTTLFHTRWATHGEVIDKNCHPFIVGTGIYAHNGVFWRAEEFVERMARDEVRIPVGDNTDSLVLAYVAEHFDNDFMRLSKLGNFGVLVRANDDFTARVVVSGGDFYAAKTRNGLWMFASGFPKNSRYFSDVRRFKNKSVATISKDGVKFDRGGFFKLRGKRAKPSTFQTSLVKQFGYWSGAGG